MKKVLSAIALLILMTGCQSAQDAEKAKTQKLVADSQRVAEQAKATLPKLEVLEQSDVSENGNTYVVGTARATEEISYGQLSFGVLDSEGNRIGTAMANISNLGPGATWKFKALIVQKEAASVSPPEIFTK
jgi:hypothetical protein